MKQNEILLYTLIIILILLFVFIKVKSGKKISKEDLKGNVVGFSDSKYAKRSKDWEKEAKNKGRFSTVEVKNESNLPQHLIKYAQDNPRGFGYYRWKPFIIKEKMKSLPDGEVLVYVDIGCSFSNTEESSTERNFLFSLLDESDKGILVFELDGSELHYTKASVINFFDLNISPKSKQRLAGIIFFKVSPFTRQFVDEWWILSRDYPELFEDSHNENERSVFIEHRHDQSVFSLLTKKHNIKAHPDLTYPPGKKHFISASRKKY